MSDLNYNKHYSRFHQFSDEYYEVMARSYQRFFRGLLPIDKAAPIIDIGCGTGFAAHALRKAGYGNAVGIDADLTQVEIARPHQLGIACRRLRGDDSFP